MVVVLFFEIDEEDCIVVVINGKILTLHSKKGIWLMEEEEEKRERERERKTVKTWRRAMTMSGDADSRDLVMRMTLQQRQQQQQQQLTTEEENNNNGRDGRRS